MNKANGNEPAYPSHGSMGEVVLFGMTKREVIAKDILSGIVSMTSPPTKWQIENRALYLSETSMLAVDLADALLEALEKETD